jgi:hypothetical protein
MRGLTQRRQANPPHLSSGASSFIITDEGITVLPVTSLLFVNITENFLLSFCQTCARVGVFVYNFITESHNF